MATWSPCFKFALKIPHDTGIKFGVKNTTSMVTIQNDTNIEFGMTLTFTAMILLLIHLFLMLIQEKK